MAKLKNNPEVQLPPVARTPAPKNSDNTFPSFTPMSTRTARQTAKIFPATQIDFQEFPPTTCAKRTKIPAGVSLEQIPSPGNLKPKKHRQDDRRNDDIDDLAKDVEGLGIGKAKGKGKKDVKTKTNAKGKIVLDQSESEEDEKPAISQRSTRVIRTRLKILDAIDNGDKESDIEPMNLDPFFKDTTAQPLFPRKGLSSKPLARTKSKSPTKRSRTTSTTSRAPSPTRPSLPTTSTIPAPSPTILTNLAPFSSRTEL